MAFHKRNGGANFDWPELTKLLLDNGDAQMKKKRRLFYFIIDNANFASNSLDSVRIKITATA